MGARGLGKRRNCCHLECLCPVPHLHPPTLTFTGPLPSGSRQIQLAVPGAYEKPQLVPLQQTTEPGLAPTFTFHVNPVLSPKLHIELEERLLVLQVSEQREENGMSPLEETPKCPGGIPLHCSLVLFSTGWPK